MLSSENGLFFKMSIGNRQWKTSDSKVIFVQDIHNSEGYRVAGGGCPPQAPTPPYVPFGIRRFTKSTRVFDALQEGSANQNGAKPTSG
jgi:hypothetical protein